MMVIGTFLFTIPVFLLNFVESGPSDPNVSRESNNNNPLSSYKMCVGPPLPLASYQPRRRPNNEEFEIIMRNNMIPGKPELRHILDRITFRTIQRQSQESKPDDPNFPRRKNNDNPLSSYKMYVGPPLPLASYQHCRRPNNEGFEIIMRKNPVTGKPEFRHILDRITFRTIQRQSQDL